MPSVNIKQYVLKLLARREHTCVELQRKLKIKNFDDHQIEVVLKELMETKLQSDERFAEAYIRMRSNKGFGPIRIQMELHQRGIHEDVIEKYLNPNDEYWLEKMCVIYRKKFGNKIQKNFQIQLTQARFLQYRGFAPEQIRTLFTEQRHCE